MLLNSLPVDSRPKQKRAVSSIALHDRNALLTLKRQPPKSVAEYNETRSIFRLAGLVKTYRHSCAC